MLFRSIFNRKTIHQPTELFIKHSVIHGRGVFTRSVIKPGELIERAPLILIDHKESGLLKQTVLHDYYFLVKNLESPIAVGLGSSSLYNHSCPSNATYTIDLVRKIIIIKAYRHINPLEEITINYNGLPEDNSMVLFTNSLAK